MKNNKTKKWSGININVGYNINVGTTPLITNFNEHRILSCLKSIISFFYSTFYIGFVILKFY